MSLNHPTRNRPTKGRLVKKNEYSAATLAVVVPLLILGVIILHLVVGAILGLAAAGLALLLFWAIDYDLGLSFLQLWLAASVAVILLSWIGNLLFKTNASAK